MPRIPRLTRELVARLPERIEDPGPIARIAHITPAFYDDIAQRLVAEAGPGVPIWVFAIGSLIWKPRFEHAERRPALVRGWRRSFCLGPDTRYRGNPRHPGLMLSLDRGGACRGLALRLPDGADAAALAAILREEPPIPPRWVRAHTDWGPLRALAFVCPRDYPGHVRGMTEGQIADCLARSVGMWGNMAEYLLNTVEHLAAEGIHDAYLWRMQDLVAERLEKAEPTAAP
jgi:cation transport protein ChaC